MYLGLVQHIDSLYNKTSTGPQPGSLSTHFASFPHHACNKLSVLSGPNFFKIRWVILEIELVKMHTDRCTGVIMRPFYAFRSNALAREAVYSYYSLSNVQSRFQVGLWKISNQVTALSQMLYTPVYSHCYNGIFYSYYYYYYYYYYCTMWMSPVTGLFFPVLLLNQRWSPPLTLQTSHCSTFRIMCDVPSTAVFCIIIIITIIITTIINGYWPASRIINTVTY